MKFDPNDPKWTAYVLNELDDRERAAIEQEIATHPEARKLLEEIRETTGLLAAALTREPAIELTDVQKQRIELAADERPSRHSIRFPVWGSVALGAAAALVVAVVGIQMQMKERSTSEVASHGAVTTPAEIDDEVATLEGAVIREESQFAYAPAQDERNDNVNKSDFKGPNDADIQELGLLDSGLAMGRSGGARISAPATLPAREQVVSRNAVGYTAAMSPSESSRHLYYRRVGIPNTLSELPPSSIISPSLDDFAELRDNVFQRVSDHPLSTFSIDVDTASYSVVRKLLSEGRLPPKDAVRIEELINYFPYEYAPPRDGKPFASNMEVAPCPWKPEHYLVRVALKGHVIGAEERPALNLVYLLDVSGSMNSPNRLPLVKRSLQALVKQLDERDRVAIVVYAGAAGLVLPSTRGDNAQAIYDAIERLEAGGSTAGGAGIQLAYQTARGHFQSNAVNRVILCTDGDFNVGLTQRGDLEQLIEQEAKSGVFLTVLGFGMGNYKDSTLELLSNKGNGNYAYIDDFSEARKVLVDQMLGTLVTIAKDVKIQVQFNPAHVAGYRLIGYENRMLKKEDFNNDKVDAGEIGAGHTVTAFYEIIPVGQPFPDVPAVDELKYQSKPIVPTDADEGEILTLKLRYKEPDGDVSSKLEFPLQAEKLNTMDPSRDFRFASAVAGFGMLLRESDQRGSITYEQVLTLAESSIGEDPFGYRAEFIKLVRNAMAIAGEKPQ